LLCEGNYRNQAPKTFSSTASDKVEPAKVAVDFFPRWKIKSLSLAPVRASNRRGGELSVPIYKKANEGFLRRLNEAFGEHILGRIISLPDIEQQLAPNNLMASHSLVYSFDTRPGPAMPGWAAFSTTPVITSNLGDIAPGLICSSGPPRPDIRPGSSPV
jgi:hypothetical protein